MTPELFRVKKRVLNNHNVVTLTLDPKQKFHFLPGQFNMLYAFGIGEIPISISGAPQNPKELIHTIKNVGAVSQAIFNSEVKTQIGVRGPYGKGWPLNLAKGKDLILVAGGIGLAPLRPVLEYVSNNRDEFNKVILLYGARRKEDLLFQEDFARWRSNQIECLATLDLGDPNWNGHVGLVTSLLNYIDFNPDKALAMICGPEIMFRFVSQDLIRRGMFEKEIYLSLERNMKCAIGNCGHCQLGPYFLCQDGPVVNYQKMKKLISIREL